MVLPLVIFFLVVMTSANPGVLIGFTPEIVNLALKTFLPDIEKSLKHMEFAGAEFPVVTTKGLSTDMAVDNIRFENIQLYTENTGLVFKPSGEISINIPDILMNLKFDWVLKSHVNKKVIQQGEAKIVVSKASVLINLLLNKDLKEVITLDKCEFDIEKIEIIMDKNPASAVINWYLDAINKRIRGSIEKEIDLFLNSVVKAWLGNAQRLDADHWVSLTSWLQMNAKFTQPISIDSKHVEIKLDGTCRKHSSDYKIDIPNLSNLKYETQDMIAVYISEYTLNTISLSHFKTSPISLTSDSLNIPLSTPMLVSILPSIVSDFGVSPCSISLTQSSTFLFSLSASELSTPVSLSLDLSIKDLLILSLSIQVDLSSSLSISKSILSGSFTQFSFTKIDLISSTLTIPPDMDNLRAFAKGLQFFIRSLLTSKLFGSGIPLPSPIQDYFPDLQLSLADQSVLIETNIKSS